MDVNWTEDRVETLRKLWAEGLSASQIAAQLGSVSRNAVIGKVHRLKLSSRGRSTSAAPRVKKQSAATSVSVSKTVKASAPMRTMTASVGATALQISFDAEPVARHRTVENVVVPISRALKLVELNERTCKWPNGDPLSETFSFCGNDSAETGPYCKYHARVAFQPASERRRVR
jgi:GcrA cell cycle regulator